MSKQSKQEIDMNNTQDFHLHIYNQLVNQFNQLKMNYSKFLNIRVDFHYGSNQPNNINKAYQDMTYLYHMFKLANNGVIGCQFVPEYSTTNLLHIHALFFINGQQYQKYYPFYLWLNDFWLKMTSNLGHTVDCNNAKKYEYPIVGKVKTYQDNNCDKGMSRLIRYLSKTNQKDPISNFYNCFTSEIEQKKKQGKPRSHNTNLLPNSRELDDVF